MIYVYNTGNKEIRTCKILPQAPLLALNIPGQFSHLLSPFRLLSHSSLFYSFLPLHFSVKYSAQHLSVDGSFVLILSNPFTHFQQPQ
jgi:hypothetical protein